MKKPLICSLWLLMLTPALFGQGEPLPDQTPPGWYVWDLSNNKPVYTLDRGDTLNLTEIYEDTLTIRYVLPDTTDQWVYHLDYSQEVRYLWQPDSPRINVSSGGSNYFNLDTLNLLKYIDYAGVEYTRDRLEYDELFRRDGRYPAGKWTLTATGGREIGVPLVWYDSTEVYLYWDAPYDLPRYYVLDPLLQKPIAEIQDGDTLTRYTGYSGAILYVDPPGPDHLNLVHLEYLRPGLTYAMDSSLYLWSGLLTYSEDGVYNYPVFRVPGYPGSGEYWVVNQFDQRDEGIRFYVQRLETLPNVKDSTILNLITKDSIVYRFTTLDSVIYTEIYQDCTVTTVIYRDSVIWNYVNQDSTIFTYIDRDSVIWNYIDRDSVIWNYVRRDSILWNFIYQDSTVWTFIHRDTTVYDTSKLDAYTELVLPLILLQLQQIGRNAEELEAVLRRIDEEGLREKSIYETLEEMGRRAGN